MTINVLINSTALFRQTADSAEPDDIDNCGLGRHKQCFYSSSASKFRKINRCIKYTDDGDVLQCVNYFNQ